ncbi:MAG: hypothetical protein R3D25_13545 [Geminicoccaceae bacterium]
MRLSRRPEDRVDRAVLDHPAALHHRDPVRHLGDHAHVVRDQQHRHAIALLQRPEQPRDLAWVVTSKAVVGSSAMSTCGWQDSAIAISARWRMPPLSWKG